MAAKEYEIRIEVTHVVWVTADSKEEAEELAFDQFSDDAGLWDDVYTEIIGVEDI
jgi:hypothetical protein